MSGLDEMWGKLKEKIPKPVQRRIKIIKSYVGWEDYLALAAILIGALGYISGPIPFIQGWAEFYHDIRSDLIALGITVLIIDNVNEMYRRRAEKERLTLQMGSPDNGFAIEAVRQLRVKEWLVDGSLIGVNLFRANLSEADLSGANLRNAFLIDANLSKASLSEANLSEATLAEANLRWSDLTTANLSRADLSGANLSGANLFSAKLNKAFLSGADMSGADMRYTDLSGARLYSEGLSDISGKYLSGANMSRVNLSTANLSGAEFDNETRWPQGFDPVAAGAVPVEANE